MTTTARRLAPALLVLSLLATGLLPPAAARADAPMRLAAQVTDPVGALDDRRPEVDRALGTLASETGLQLFVVFVDSFDGTPAQTWTDETARRSDLGDRDALLAVATGDRSYAYSFARQAPLTDAELGRVAQSAIEPALSRGDWAGAVIGATDGYRAAAGGRGGTAPSRTSSGPSGWTLLLCLLVPLAAVAAGLRWRRSRRGGVAGPAAPQAAAPVDPRAGVSTEELSNRANTLLLQLDDDLRASERELDLATGQYGADTTAAFRAALDSARQEVAEAFRLRLSLDGQPPDEAGTRAVLAEIIRRCEQADARLDAEADAFDRLRDIESRADEVADEVERDRAAVEADLPAATALLRDLTSRYAGATVAGVAGNVEQARERLAFAVEAVRRAREALAGDRPEAALAVRAASQAVDQAGQLVAAVRRSGEDLAAAGAAVAGLVSEVRSEVAQARAARKQSGDRRARRL